MRSRFGDNALEMDGAEDSDAQPVTTAAIYNFTVVGQPESVGSGTTWRDNARVQIRNSIFMELGTQLVYGQDVDGDGGRGYGYNGTLSWADTWTTDYSVYSTVNAGSWTAGAFNDPAVLYTAQSAGKLAEIKDSVFYENNAASAYTESTARGVHDSANNNVTASSMDMPVAVVDRGDPVTVGSFGTIVPVTNINPCAANDAVTSVAVHSEQLSRSPTSIPALPMTQ